MSINEINKLVVKHGAKAARFVVDLKMDLPKAEATQIKASRSAKFEEKLEKLSEVDYGEMMKKGRENSGVWLTNMIKALKPEIASLPPFARNDRLINQLAFVQVGKLLFSLIFKISYAVGWMIMFALRLVYFILLALFKPFKKIFYFVFAKSHPAIHKITRDIPAGYQATQAVAMTVVKNFWIPAYAGMTKGGRPLAMTDKKASPPYPPFKGGLRSLLKPVLVFAGVLLAIVLPVKAFTFYKSLDGIKGRVLGASESALSDLVDGGKDAAGLNFNGASENFSRAGDSFLSAQNQLNDINGLIFSLASVIPDKNMQLAAAVPHILKAGELSAAAGKNLSLAADGIFNRVPDNNLINILNNLSLYGGKGLSDLNALKSELAQINSGALPEKYRADFILLKQKAGELAGGLNEFIALADNLKIFLGAETDKRYLLVFQNNSELRASGGFIGSYAIMDFSKGLIKNIEAPGGGSYDTDAGLLLKIKSPEPLRVVRPDWHFWDANWWPDWPTTARKLAWFYDHSGGSTVDGVLSFTPTVMEKLLRIIGPIDMTEKYGLIFNADNFWLETQKLSEQKPDVTRQPKKIIGDLMNELIEELPKRITQDNLAELFKITEESLNDKNILFYFSDPELEAKAAELGWDGKIKNTSGDYLNVVNTNIAGGKSDREIKQEIIHTAEVQPDGSIIDSLTIRRTHQAVNRAPFVGARNVDWVRIYVPAGSQLLEASGFKPLDKIFFKPAEEAWADDPDVAEAESGEQTDEISRTKIYSELGKTVFANWSQVDPGETAEIYIKYKLPFRLTDKKTDGNTSLADKIIARASKILNSGQSDLYAYSLLAQKQPGMNASSLTSRLELSGDFKFIWNYPDDLATSQSGWLMTENLEQDKLMAGIVEK